MENLLSKLFVFLTDLSGGSAYFMIFGILVVCGLGFPLPEDIPLVAAGYLVWDGTMDWAPALLLTLIGVLLGDTILFFLGRKLGIRILEQERVQTFFRPEIVRRTRAYFRKYGDKIIFIARFFAGFRAAAFFIAGAMKLEYKRFILLDALAAVVSVPVWIGIGYGLGYSLGDEISQILKSIKHFKNIFTVAIVVIAVAFLIKSYFAYRKARAQKEART